MYRLYFPKVLSNLNGEQVVKIILAEFGLNTLVSKYH